MTRQRGGRLLLWAVVAAALAALEPRPDAVFNALHGRWGEDGNVQGVLNILGLPYTHSGLLASAMAMDKVVAKRLFAAAGITCPEGVVVNIEAVLTRHVMEPPYVVKPINEGSSGGVHIVMAGDNYPGLDRAAWKFGDEVLVEPQGAAGDVGLEGGRRDVVDEAISPRPISATFP